MNYFEIETGKTNASDSQLGVGHRRFCLLGVLFCNQTWLWDQNITKLYGHFVANATNATMQPTIIPGSHITYKIILES